MKCVLCERELLIHERPQRGLPGLCDGCARARQVWPARGEREPAAKRSRPGGELEWVTAPKVEP